MVFGAFWSVEKYREEMGPGGRLQTCGRADDCSRLMGWLCLITRPVLCWRRGVKAVRKTGANSPPPLLPNQEVAEPNDGRVATWIEATSHPHVRDAARDHQPYYLGLPTRQV